MPAFSVSSFAFCSWAPKMKVKTDVVFTAGATTPLCLRGLQIPSRSTRCSTFRVRSAKLPLVDGMQSLFRECGCAGPAPVAKLWLDRDHSSLYDYHYSVKIWAWRFTKARGFPSSKRKPSWQGDICLMQRRGHSRKGRCLAPVHDFGRGARASTGPVAKVDGARDERAAMRATLVFATAFI